MAKITQIAGRNMVMSVAWAKVNQCEDRYVEGNRASWKALEDVTDELKE